MTPSVAPTMPTAKPASAQAAKGNPASDALAMLSGQGGEQGFGQPFEQLLQQQMGPAALPANLASLLPGTHAAEASLAAIDVPANIGGDDPADPAERNGNVMAAAMLAMLGQSQNVVQKTAAGQIEQGVGDATQGSRAHGLVQNTATGAVMNDAATPVGPSAQGMADASTLLAAAKASDEAAPRKAEPAAIAADILAAPLTAQGSHAAMAAQTHNLQMESPAGTPAFAQELSQHVAWLGGHDVKEARIRLRPEELGQLDVKVSVAEHGKVDVSFTAQHPQAVQAVQQTLGQLDLMLAGHGLSLGQAQVGQQGGGGQGTLGPGGQAGELAASDEGAAEVPTITKAMGLLDTFA